MELNDNTTNALLESIRKELNSIIEEKPLEKEKSVSTTPLNTKKVKTPRKKYKSPTRFGIGISSSSFKRGLQETNIPKKAERVAFLDSKASQSIDEDLQKMQLDLQQSYELFQTIGEKFEAINFARLKNRIRDLHLNDKNNEVGKATAASLNEMFQQSFKNKSLDKLTNEMGTKFRKHPGEFGDIPELSAFFKACTQLQNGLEQLKKQRQESNTLSKRVCWAADISFDRIDEIRETLGQKL